MLIRLLTDRAGLLGKAQRIGDLVEVSAKEAGILVDRGSAEWVDATELTEPEVESAMVDHKPARNRRGKK